MAHIEMKMQSHGMERPCDGCGEKWSRGQQMNGVVYEDGESAGMYCDECMSKWRQGDQPGAGPVDVTR